MSQTDLNLPSIAAYAAAAIGAGLLIAAIGQLVDGPGSATPPPPAVQNLAASGPVTPQASKPTAPAGPTPAELMDAQQPVAAQIVPTVATPASSRSYRNCREARAAGAAPLYRGTPGYGAHMDGDNDGIACEPYRR